MLYLAVTGMRRVPVFAGKPRDQVYFGLWLYGDHHSPQMKFLSDCGVIPYREKGIKPHFNPVNTAYLIPITIPRSVWMEMVAESKKEWKGLISGDNDLSKQYVFKPA